MTKFISNLFKNYFDVYAYEDDSSSYLIFDNQFNDHVIKVDPVTGKKVISVSKILKRVFIFFLFSLGLLLITRMFAVGW